MIEEHLHTVTTFFLQGSMENTAAIESSNVNATSATYRIKNCATYSFNTRHGPFEVESLPT